MHWLEEIEYKDLLTGDMGLVHDSCGAEVLFRLWEEMPGITIYISERSLFQARKRYIRKFYDGTNAKKLALKLKTSDRFVYDTLAETEEKNERQERLFK